MGWVNCSSPRRFYSGIVIQVGDMYKHSYTDLYTNVHMDDINMSE